MRSLCGARGRASPRDEGRAAVATIALDTLGSDRGVAEIAAGALSAAERGTSCLLFGPLDELRAAVGDTDLQGIELVDAPDLISNRDEPARAVRARAHASIVQAADAVAQGRADALVSPGSTGATLAASLLRIKRIPGVYRPAVAALLPVPGRRLLMLDVGANTEVRSEQLVQFAFMGAAFSQDVLGVARPRVGLLSVGEESSKGTDTVVEANRTLAATSIDFAGNVEGNDLTAGGLDVVVTDGFTGNIALKAIEGTLGTLVGAIRDRISSGLVSQVGGLLIRSRLRGLRDELDPETVGGAYLLGLRSPVVICHGGSTRRAIASAIDLAARGVDERVVERTAGALQRAGLVRGGDATSRQAEPGPVSVGADSVETR